MEELQLKRVGASDLRSWLEESEKLGRFTRSIGRDPVSPEYLEDTLGLPYHLEFTMRGLVEEDPTVGLDQLASIPFYSLCKGLFLPLTGLQPDRIAAIFGVASDPAPNSQEREALLNRFFDATIGLTLVQKLSCVLGDPFRGKGSTLRRDSLVTLLLSLEMKSRQQLLDRLTVVGDVSVLFAESRKSLKVDPPLTAAEVLETLRLQAQPGVPRAKKFSLLRALLERCGKLEAYFVAKLMLRKAGFGFDYQGALIARALAQQFGAMPEAVQHAMALTDAFRVAEVLSEHGPAGLRSIQLQPLVAVRPALASGSTDDIKSYPVWVERKYDGIRFMLHKSTDEHGAVLTGAYTRNRRDWLEMVPGLANSIRMLPVKSCIVDGELYGTTFDLEGARPASVYEVYAALQGQTRTPVNLKFAAFDLVYLNGADMTSLPLHQRRDWLQRTLGPVQNLPLPVPLQIAEGQLANTKDDLSRLYHHFRSQGYEGIISKKLDGPYLLSSRDPNWHKRKPEITLDLVLLGAVFAVTEKTNVGTFGSYVIGARTPEGGFVDVGDVAGLDRVRDAQIQGEIMREGLITGRRIERQSASGTRPGMELRPSIVVTVRFEGIVKDSLEGELKLRDPKLVMIRSDKSAMEADSTKNIEELWLRQRVG
ncbi:MAG: hypothetical protein H6737_26915 [Alphaproteobacteria bacterium]|nr:hypothetical protein [Alphaproteobacteria bacterium]